MRKAIFSKLFAELLELNVRHGRRNKRSLNIFLINHIRYVQMYIDHKNFLAPVSILNFKSNHVFNNKLMVRK